jgi:hypothetical protein
MIDLIPSMPIVDYQETMTMLKRIRAEMILICRSTLHFWINEAAMSIISARIRVSIAVVS